MPDIHPQFSAQYVFEFKFVPSKSNFLLSVQQQT